RSMRALLETTDQGLYCAAGDFYIDPWRPVARAIITHAHSDHARAGSQSYLTAARGVEILRDRLGADSVVQGLPFGETVDHSGVRVSLHPAGHILGSAQVRIEYRGEVWVVSGDYKLEDDHFCTPYESVKCNVFITESTFGLPIYKWQRQDIIFNEINAWHAKNKSEGKASILMGYAL